VWHRVRPRPLAQAAAGGGRRLHDPPTALKPLGPSPRRGHSAVVIGGFMYVFGGRQDGYPCDVASTNTNRRGLNDIDPSTPTTTFCRTEGSVGATNELWRFDPRTHTWSLLDTVRRDIGLCYTCWWYSLCTFQYRQHYEQTGSDHFDCCMYTNLYFFMLM